MLGCPCYCIGSLHQNCLKSFRLFIYSSGGSKHSSLLNPAPNITIRQKITLTQSLPQNFLKVLSCYLFFFFFYKSTFRKVAVHFCGCYSSEINFLKNSLIVIIHVHKMV